MYLATASNVLLSKLSGGTLSSMGEDVSWPIFFGNQAPPLPFVGLGLVRLIVRFVFAAYDCCYYPMKLVEHVLKEHTFSKDL